MRLIDAEPMENQVKNTYGDIPNLKFGLLRWIAYQPTVDAVPVVHCKDCECWHTTECALDYAMFEPTEFSFCSYGKRKDGADHDT